MIPQHPSRAVDLMVIDPRHLEDPAPAATNPQLSEKD